MAPFELWGGVECTVNRIGDTYFDQTRRSGHHDRIEDLDLFASLGLQALRYPVLWERVAPEGLASADWTWTDARLDRIRALGMRPIAGLVHHGSGPRTTHLLDPRFAEGLANYAAAVAERYPWVDDYTPINEPLTTARFSGLYGYWYPHHRSDRSFVMALVNQARATVLGMQAIRRINPRARLIQTEDGGRTNSTRTLAAQAAFENHRRWLSLDLLTGRVTPRHPLWSWLVGAGASQQDLEWLAHNPCPPDIVGLNYYFTSDRWLDERLELYPACAHGGNGRLRYADVEAVRVATAGLAGHARVLQEAWERYRLPAAITEVHAGCTREEQVRWLAEAWSGAEDARLAGADVRAVTSWALLGTFDWDTLLRHSGAYEPGAFDVRSQPPRATALAALVRQLAAGAVRDPVAHQPGWWERPGRVLFGRPSQVSARPVRIPAIDRRPLIVTGARGTLGSAVVRAATDRGLSVCALSRRELDITDADRIRRAIDRFQPWAVVNAAGHVLVDEAELEPAACMEANATGPALLADACRVAGVRFVTISSDLVFDGGLRRPYVETDSPSPLNVYGMSKLDAEVRVRAACPQALIVRTSAFFGVHDAWNFVTLALRALAEDRCFMAAADTIVSPTYVPDLVDAMLDLLLDNERSIWHLANAGAVTWAELASRAARMANLDPRLVVPLPMNEVAGPARRPPYSALASSRGTLLPALDHALGRYVAATPWRVPDPSSAGHANAGSGEAASTFVPPPI